MAGEIENLQGRITKAAEREPKFRVGDRVKDVSDPNSPIGTVKQVTPSEEAEGVWVYWVQWPTKKRELHAYDEHELVKV